MKPAVTMAMKVLFNLKILKNDSKKQNYGIAIWQLLLIIVSSGIIAYLILFTQQNQLPFLECIGENENNDEWVKCRQENINNQKK